MATTLFEQVVEQVKALNSAEQWHLRDLLEIWLAPPQQPLTEEQLEQELVREGIISIPPPITDFTPYQNRQLAEVKGKPVSEIIVEERR